MYKNNEILLQQICRFGLLDFAGLQKMNTERYTIRTLSRYLRALWISGYVKKITNVEYYRGIYAATPFAYTELYGVSNKSVQFASSNKIKHSLKFAETLFQMSKYENVTGIATEFELAKADLSDFIIGRIPDGILQIEREDSKFEVAIEYELNQKSIRQIRNLIQAYEETFRADFLCRAAFIVCEHKTIENAYQRQLEQFSANVQNRIKILTKYDLTKLDKKYFGQPTESIDRFWKTKRHCGQGRGQPTYETIEDFIVSPPHSRDMPSFGDNTMEVSNG